MAIARCLGRISRLKDDYKKAEDILENVLSQCCFLQEDFRLGSLFIQNFYLTEDIKKAQGIPAHSDDMCFIEIQYSYAINKLYLQDDRYICFIERYLEKYYNDKTQVLKGLL